MWLQKARPSRTPRPGAVGRGARRPHPADHEQQRPGTEGQHLDVVPVVAQAVPGHEGRGEGRVEPRAQHRGSRRPRHEGGEAHHRGHEARIEEDRGQGERPGGVIDDGGQEGGEMRLEAAAVGDTGHEHEVLGPLQEAEHDDAGQGPVGRHRSRGPLDDEGQAEKDGQGDGQPAVSRGQEGRTRGSELRPPARSQGQRTTTAEAARARGGTASSHRGRIAPTSNQRQTRSSQRRAAAAPDRASISAGAPRTRGRGRSGAGGGRPASRSRISGNGPGPIPSPLEAVELGLGREPVEQQLEVEAGGAPYFEAGLGQERPHLVVAQLRQVVGAEGTLRAVGEVGEAQAVGGGEDEGRARLRGTRELGEGGTRIGQVLQELAGEEGVEGWPCGRAGAPRLPRASAPAGTPPFSRPADRGPRPRPRR